MPGSRLSAIGELPIAAKNGASALGLSGGDIWAQGTVFSSIEGYCALSRFLNEPGSGCGPSALRPVFDALAWCYIGQINGSGGH